MKKLHEDNKQLTGKIRDLLDENREQKKINSQLKKEITEIKTLLKSSEIKELFKIKSTLLQSHDQTVADPDGNLNDDNKSVKTIGTISSKHRIKLGAEPVNSSSRTPSKRQLLTDNQQVASNGVAFFAYLSKNEPNAGAHQTFVFDVDHTNIGGHYSHHTGVFTCPSHGVYVFSWSIFCSTGGEVYSELVVNSSPVSGKYVGSVSVSNILSSTDLAIVELNAGDEVYIRTPPNHAAGGQVKNLETKLELLVELELSYSPETCYTFRTNRNVPYKKRPVLCKKQIEDQRSHFAILEDGGSPEVSHCKETRGHLKIQQLTKGHLQRNISRKSKGKISS
uniref:Complement C1q-like protein 4 n=1 Tax=Magallana gigas TaxID=29159 RepID=K1QPM5_MAGGI